MVEKKIGRVLHFLLGTGHFCVDLHYVNKILPLVALEYVPSSPPYLVGMMNLAGEALPVVDLATRIGMKRLHPYSVDTPILHCSADKQAAGLVVDKIIGLSDVSEAELQSHHVLQTTDHFYLGSVMIENTLTLFVNMTEVLKATEHYE